MLVFASSRAAFSQDGRPLRRAARRCLSLVLVLALVGQGALLYTHLHPASPDSGATPDASGFALASLPEPHDDSGAPGSRDPQTCATCAGLSHCRAPGVAHASTVVVGSLQSRALEPEAVDPPCEVLRTGTGARSPPFSLV